MSCDVNCRLAEISIGAMIQKIIYIYDVLLVFSDSLFSLNHVIILFIYSPISKEVQ